MADEDAEAPRRGRSSIDLATALGLLSGFGLVLLTIFHGGSAKAFIDVPSILIVLGGTAAVTAICFSPAELGRTFQVMGKTMFQSVRDPAEAALQVLQIADTARRQGVLALQAMLPELRPEPFLHKGMSMVSDGTPGEEVEAIMQRDILATQQRHLKCASVLRKASEFSPAMGLIGLVHRNAEMLGRLDDPSTIGPSMALALLTTFYGAVLANMVFTPLASKLERNSIEEALVNNVYMMGAASIGRQENPRRLEMLLNSVLPPAKRVQYFD